MNPTPPAAKPGLSLPVKIAIALAFALLAYWVLDQGQSSGTVIGKKLAPLHLQPLTGDPPKFDADSLQGHVTLIDFWGPWCPPCKRELPYLVAIGKELSDRPEFQFVAVSCGDEDQTLDDIRKQTEDFLNEAGIKQPTYGDRNSKTRQILQREYAMEGYPYTLLVDRQGVIRNAWAGYSPGEEKEILSEILETLDGEKK